MYIVNDKDDRKQNSKSGVSFEGDIKVASIKDTIARYIINGIIMFFVAYGSVECFVSAFSISYKKFMLFFVLFILSMLYSFMHINPTAHKIGYVTILFSYLYIVLKLKIVIKSGFARIVNETFEQISNKIYVDKVRKYTEYVDDYKAATTLCLIIIGFVLLLILNIIISEYLNVTITMVMTIPLVVAGPYFGYNPDVYGLIMYVVAIVGLLVLRINSPRNIHNTQVKFDEKNSGETKIYEFTIIPKIHGQIMLVIIILVSIFSGIFTLQLKNKKNNDSIVVSTIKNKLNTKISKIISYENEDGDEISLAGGLSEGRLGDVPSIQFDNKDDLIVRFIPKSKENVYLRGYVGSVYQDNRWYSIADTNKKKISKNFERVYGIYDYDRANLSANILERNFGKGSNTSMYKMEVNNVGADSKYIYMPYYTKIEEGFMKVASEDKILANNKVFRYVMEYYPNNPMISDTTKYSSIYNNIESQYASYVRNVYTQLPEKNREKLLKLCEKEGFEGNDEEIIAKIQDYFRKSYVYSLKCGTTPDDKDFVNYFIDTKKGFCAHFASTAALILRTLGIPARYVEGYVITKDMIEKGQILANKSDYIAHEIENGDYNAIEVRVPDSRAHAWIEVYKDGFGWVPYEMTVYNRREDINNSNVYNTNRELGMKDYFTIIKENFKESIIAIVRYSKNIMTVLLIIIIVGFLALCMKALLENIRRRQRLNSRDNNTNMIWLVSYLFKLFELLGYKRKKGITVDEYFEELKEKQIVDDDLLKRVSILYKKAGFSVKGISEIEYKEIKEYIEKTIKIKYNDLSLRDKIRFIIL